MVSQVHVLTVAFHAWCHRFTFSELKFKPEEVVSESEAFIEFAYRRVDRTSDNDAIPRRPGQKPPGIGSNQDTFVPKWLREGAAKTVAVAAAVASALPGVGGEAAGAQPTVDNVGTQLPVDAGEAV
jgi:hypothetical protein